MIRPTFVIENKPGNARDRNDQYIGYNFITGLGDENQWLWRKIHHCRLDSIGESVNLRTLSTTRFRVTQAFPAIFPIV
jgi:uncharacterized protein with NRDE domain